MTETFMPPPLKAAPRRAGRSGIKSSFRASPVSLKGTLIAAAIFGLVYAATLVVLFAPKEVLQGQPASYVPPVMGTTITMQTSLPDLGTTARTAAAP